MAPAPEHVCRGAVVRVTTDCKARGTKVGMWIVYESSILNEDAARRTSLDVYILEEDAKNAGIAMMEVSGAMAADDPIRAKRAFTWTGLTNGQLRFVDANWEKSIAGDGGGRRQQDPPADEFIGRIFKGVTMPRVTMGGEVVTEKVDVTVAAAEGGVQAEISLTIKAMASLWTGFRTAAILHAWDELAGEASAVTKACLIFAPLHAPHCFDHY